MERRSEEDQKKIRDKYRNQIPSEDFFFFLHLLSDIIQQTTAAVFRDCEGKHV